MSLPAAEIGIIIDDNYASLLLETQSQTVTSRRMNSSKSIKTYKKIGAPITGGCLSLLR